MMPVTRSGDESRLRRRIASVGAVATVTIFATVLGAPVAMAAESPVGMGSAAPFAVLAGTTVTNTGPSTISGDVGVSPGSAVTGFPPGQVTNGSIHAGDAVASGGQSSLTTAYNDAAGRTPATVEANPDLGGQTLAPGVYKVATGMSLTGTVTLDGQNDPSAVFIFQAGSTLVTASNSSVKLIGGAQACNVFWQVGSSATLGTQSTFVGTVMALTSASVQTGATVAGRILARNGQVSLDDNTITAPTCTAATSTPTTSTTAGAAATGTSTAGTAATGTTTAGAGATASSGVIPTGAPNTGAGGSVGSGDNVVLIALGGMALVGAGVAAVQAVRRRRAYDGSGSRDA